MEPNELRRWIEGHGYTVSGLARDLRVGRRQLHRYLDGTTPIPGPVEVALEALEARQEVAETR